MRDGFKKIFWGLILITFHINVSTFDILPDFVGFYLIYVGCNSLKNEDESFKRACIPALALMVISILSIVNNIYPTMSGGYGSFMYMVSVIWNVVVRIVNITIVYYICIGIYNISLKFNDVHIQRRTKFILRNTLIIFILTEIATSILLNGKNGLLEGIIIVLLIAGFILKLLLIALVNRSGKDFIVD